MSQSTVRNSLGANFFFSLFFNLNENRINHNANYAKLDKLKCWRSPNGRRGEGVTFHLRNRTCMHGYLMDWRVSNIVLVS